MERALVELVLRLHSRGWDVSVVTRPGGDLANMPRLRVCEIRVPQRPFLALFPSFYVLAGWRILRERRGRLVQTIGALVPNRADVVTVQFVHKAFASQPATLRGSRRGWISRLNAPVSKLVSRTAERFSYRPERAGLLVAVSRGIEDELRASYPSLASRIAIIPNGVDREIFRPDADARRSVRQELQIPQTALVATLVGGDWRRKGLSEAIDGLAQAGSWHLLVVGPGAPDEYVAQAKRLDVDGRLHFAGQQPDPHRYMAAADAFVLPTAYEAFPLVVLEAAAVGLPLVVTPVNGAREFVRNGQTGFIIDRTGVSVGTALRRLTDDETRRVMGEAARADTAPYSWDSICDAYEELYRTRV